MQPDSGLMLLTNVDRILIKDALEKDKVGLLKPFFRLRIMSFSPNTFVDKKTIRVITSNLCVLREM